MEHDGYKLIVRMDLLTTLKGKIDLEREQLAIRDKSGNEAIFRLYPKHWVRKTTQVAAFKRWMRSSGTSTHAQGVQISINEVEEYMEDCWVANQLAREAQEYLGPELRWTAAKISSLSKCEVTQAAPRITAAELRCRAGGSPPITGSDDLGHTKTASVPMAGAEPTRCAGCSSPPSGSSKPGRVEVAPAEAAPLAAAEIS